MPPMALWCHAKSAIQESANQYYRAVLSYRNWHQHDGHFPTKFFRERFKEAGSETVAINFRTLVTSANIAL
ncbi:hypothetical protein BELL_0108g00110 [Botrytis elliptica]|uniref:Uncharacterized protein n=1 Tax=Botrytis elliptica TaxID=278938 RepID=A0A4Z1JW72_9HELO|nr:hypothetical protein BELL_0108g00110 [Botrytis elliptica]